MSSPGYPYAAPGSLSSYSENYEKMEMADHKMMSGDKMNKPMKMKKEMMMKKGM